MRLRVNRLTEISVFKPQKVESGYVGTITQYVFNSKIKVNIQPLESKLQAQIYGERVNEMLSMLMRKESIIQKGDCVAITGDKPTHRVISLKEYTQHLQAIVEVCNEQC